ncbi:MAG: PHP domain-containing protein [Tissierellales bacterium]|nr:PHP domain-containing protein [Tissierellales bacterium]MBN2827838.1 PHP domain-containing protein [Tissierellales bacterium]
MKFYYDFHIHSDLSPCADGEMTPNNIVKMAKLKELNIISVTDHNAIDNFPALEKVAYQEGLYILPGIEITARENVHLLAYFREYEEAKGVADIIYAHLPNIKNKPSIFGEQNIYDENDVKTDHLEKLLINATDLSIKEITSLVSGANGILIPAHVDKISYGIIGVLGFIPKAYSFRYIEVFNKKMTEDGLEQYEILHNSDAHKLADISEAENFLEGNDIEDIMKKLGL